MLADQHFFDNRYFLRYGGKPSQISLVSFHVETAVSEQAPSVHFSMETRVNSK